MITIKDNDLPITVAQKIICGTSPANNSPLVKAMAKALTNDENAGEEMDMFTLEEIEEIARYLVIYCESHKDGD